MLQIDDKVLSLDVFTQHFACDLDTCAGLCCVHGDSGAPLEKSEVRVLQREYQNFEYAMTQAGRAAVADQGLAVRDADGDLVTPLVGSAEECAYSYFTAGGCCLCAIERAYFEGKTTYRKPISCHLYPIRVKKIGDSYALSYNRWHLCQCARDKGAQEGVPVFRFLKDPIIRKFGKGFYEQMEEAYELVKKEQQKNRMGE